MLHKFDRPSYDIHYDQSRHVYQIVEVRGRYDAGCYEESVVEEYQNRNTAYNRMNQLRMKPLGMY